MSLYPLPLILLVLWAYLVKFSVSVALEESQGGKLVGPTVTLDSGGVLSDGTFNGLRNESTGIINFKGVRFADPPTGNLRFAISVENSILLIGFSQFANACIETPQNSVTSGTSEDCLFGNVYIPINTHLDDKLPVLVWFHGGGFQEGNTRDAPPELIIQSSTKPLIFVSFEYRLGQFGFLAGSQIKENGALNAGLLDQRAALRWLQKYIHLFGGDNKAITIWGQSAGAGSTMFHLVANGGNNEGLFHAAMGDSPSLSFTPTFDESYAEGIYEQFAEFAGCGNKSSSTLQCLRSASSEELTLAGSQVLVARPATLFVFAPGVDGEFLEERPVEAFKAGRFSRVPVLFGSNTDEGANWSASLTDASANTSMPNATEATVFNFLQGQYANITHSSVDSGFEIYPLEEFNSSFSLQGQQMYGEARYICSASMITGSVFKASEANTAYQYHYDNPNLGSDHGAELTAFFSSPPDNEDKDDAVLFESMREYWTSFVTGGKPVSKNGIVWKPVNESTGSSRILLHPGGVEMEQMGSLTDRCSFWHNLDNVIQT
ncbi:alpha/beta-hydrolase [Gymnopilus junonius]|uniref:Carboxylic ester hydrolase n=1 Tax=Gymnopilus junonius TaxID=109634 RepID=A0A9P5TPZ0_GYMJU|nr:alpha/beta-hydrolase [Gymnopilus junonius]